VRGARNAPCMGVPGKRAPTVEQCYSDKPYEPLAMRQHALGPRPIDPNLIAQGIAPDDRVDVQERIFAPTEGTPLPPGIPPGIIPAEPPPPGPDGAAPATPSSFGANASGPGPSVAIAHYDPQTGQYATPDGQVARQTDLVDPPKSWQDLVLQAGQ
jgi:phospholipid/cholesterol/gamma-HCH transport system substrate-binding protein